jgi:AhpD family alkylhydroperoxidase
VCSPVCHSPEAYLVVTSREMNMSTPRIDLKDQAYVPAAQAMYGLEKAVSESGLEPKLRELVKLRASQINGCAYCVDMHTKGARAHGENEQRLYCLSVWHEAPFYSERERASLEWTEELTRISESEVSDELFKRVSTHFNKEELAALTLAIIAINGWNRLAISFRFPAGTYQPQSVREAATSAV